EVKVQKRKDDKPYYRKVVRPNEITTDDIELISRTFQEKLNRFAGEEVEYNSGKGKRDKSKLFLIQNISKFFKKNFNYSTHALRYAFISFMAYAKTPAYVIAKITGHKTLDLIMHYTQKKIADHALLNLSEDFVFR